MNNHLHCRKNCSHDTLKFSEALINQQTPDLHPNQSPMIYIDWVLHLVDFHSELKQDYSNAASRLCKELQKTTEGKACLILGSDQSLQTERYNFKVQFGSTTYGVLSIIADKQTAIAPAIGLPGILLLAQVCGWLLYTLEQSFFVQCRFRQIVTQGCVQLTKSEYKILNLLCWGYNQREVSEKLCISPTTVSKHLHRIYEQLGVHNEQDALFTAYKLGVFSILEPVRDLSTKSK